MGVNVKAAANILSELALLKFFPSDPGARTALVRIVCEMATSEEQIRWLVRRMLSLYAEWPGPVELRAVFCSKFKPADGIEAISGVDSQGRPYFPEQVVPSERQIEEHKPLELPASHRFSADRQIEAAFTEAFPAVKTMPKPECKAPPPLPPGVKPITEEDVFREKQRQMERITAADFARVEISRG